MEIDFCFCCEESPAQIPRSDVVVKYNSAFCVGPKLRYVLP